MEKLNLAKNTIFKEGTSNWRVIYITVCSIVGGGFIGYKLGQGIYKLVEKVLDEVNARKLKKELQKEAEETN